MMNYASFRATRTNACWDLHVHDFISDVVKTFKRLWHTVVPHMTAINNGYRTFTTPDVLNIFEVEWQRVKRIIQTDARRHEVPVMKKMVV
jgi:hypothetical protein